MTEKGPPAIDPLAHCHNVCGGRLSLSTTVIRIISDLHWGHKASLIKDPNSLEPLLSEADTVIFNGDTLEQKFADSPAHKKSPLPSIDQLLECLQRWDTRPYFITGNHDPKVSPCHYAELNDGNILITHGDAIFDAIAPWSQNAGLLQEVATEEIARLRLNGDIAFYDFLTAIKRACVEEHDRLRDYDPSVWGKIQIFVRQAWPPTRVLKILESWKAAPRKAIEMAARFDLSPKFLIIGHTHKPAVDLIGSTTVINTGSFFPWPGATAVDLLPDKVVVRAIRKGRDRFSLGRVIGEFKSRVDLESLRFPRAEGSLENTAESAASSPANFG